MSSRKEAPTVGTLIRAIYSGDTGQYTPRLGAAAAAGARVPRRLKLGASTDEQQQTKTDHDLDRVHISSDTYDRIFDTDSDSDPGGDDSNNNIFPASSGVSGDDGASISGDQLLHDVEDQLAKGQQQHYDVSGGSDIRASSRANIPANQNAALADGNSGSSVFGLYLGLIGATCAIVVIATVVHVLIKRRRSSSGSRSVDGGDAVADDSSSISSVSLGTFVAGRDRLRWLNSPKRGHIPSFLSP